MKLKAFRKDFTKEATESNARQLDSALNNLTLADNFNASIKEVTIPAGATIDIPHGLSIVPKYRIILRQEGNGLITDDQTSPWNDKTISLKNNGVVNVNLTVMIFGG